MRDIKKAQKYTKQYVLKNFAGGRKEDVIWEANHVESWIKEIVDGQYLDANYKI